MCETPATVNSFAAAQNARRDVSELVATTIAAAKTIEETAEAEPGPTLRGQRAVASPVVLPNSAACSPRRTWDGCDRRHQPAPSRSPAASTATCSLLHLQAVTPFQRSASSADWEPGFPLAPVQLPSRRHKVLLGSHLTKRRDFDGRRH
jgi:hypothetical protein